MLALAPHAARELAAFVQRARRQNLVKRELVGVLLGAVALSIPAASLTSAGGGASDGRQDASPPIPRPFDPRTDRLGKDSTPELNMVGRPGVVIPDLGRQRAQHPVGGRPKTGGGGPATTPVSPDARCEALRSGRLAGDHVQLAAVYESTALEIALWHESGMGNGGSRAGLGMSPARSRPAGDIFVSCYFDGVFTYRGHLPAGGRPPVFERMHFLVDGAGNLFQERGGSTALLPLVRPAP